MAARSTGTLARILQTDRALLTLGFAGIHYDIEPVRPGDRGFLDLPARTHELTRARGRVLSVALEQLSLADWEAPVLRAVLPRRMIPARMTTAYLRAVAARVDQVAIMTYDSTGRRSGRTGRGPGVIPSARTADRAHMGSAYPLTCCDGPSPGPCGGLCPVSCDGSLGASFTGGCAWRLDRSPDPRDKSLSRFSYIRGGLPGLWRAVPSSCARR